MLSARNQFRATIKSIKLGNVMAEIVVTHGDIEIVSVRRTEAPLSGRRAAAAARSAPRWRRSPSAGRLAPG